MYLRYVQQLLIGRWRAYKAVTLNGDTVPYDKKSGSLMEICADGSAKYAYLHQGKWSDVKILQVVEQEGQITTITGDMFPYRVNQVTQHELQLATGRVNDDLTYYFKRLISKP
jgi:hypothetical protein